MNDAKYNKISTALAKTGHISDLEREWLQSLDVSVTSNDLTTCWMQYLDSQLVTDGTLNDRWFKWLGGLGHTGTLNDRFKKFWES